MSKIKLRKMRLSISQERCPFSNSSRYDGHLRVEKWASGQYEISLRKLFAHLGKNTTANMASYSIPIDGLLI